MKNVFIGMVYERLTVVGVGSDYVDPFGKHYKRWACKCSCVNPEILNIRGGDIGKVKSCGCLLRETTIERDKEKHKTNTYDLSGEYAVGYTLKGEEFWVDKEDVPKIEKYCWHYNRRGHLVAHTFGEKPRQTLFLHRVIMDVTDENFDVDHIKHPPRNEHKFDNRKSNLRITEHKDNCKNRTLSINNTSGVSDVSYNSRDDLWIARISVDGNRIHLGSFRNKEDAIKVRKDAEIKYYGEYRYDKFN